MLERSTMKEEAVTEEFSSLLQAIAGRKAQLDRLRPLRATH
jgi:hypothetical protein